MPQKPRIISSVSRNGVRWWYLMRDKEVLCVRDTWKQVIQCLPYHLERLRQAA